MALLRFGVPQPGARCHGRLAIRLGTGLSTPPRIGAEHGLSGRIHRVTAFTERGGSLSFIVKQETAAAVERELLFRSECGELLRGCIPRLLSAWPMPSPSVEVLVLEDVAPATQGDVLHGCTADEADAVVRLLARLHSGSWKVAGGHAPEPAALESTIDGTMHRWRDRLTRASERFPDALVPSVSSRTGDLPERVADAGERLGSGPAADPCRRSPRQHPLSARWVRRAPRLVQRRDRTARRRRGQVPHRGCR